MEQMIPLGRGGTAEEAAGAVYLLCIPESDYVSGADPGLRRRLCSDLTMRRDLFGPEHEAYRASVARVRSSATSCRTSTAWERRRDRPARAVPPARRARGLRLRRPTRSTADTARSDFRFNSILSEEAQAAGVAPALLGPTLQADVVTPYLTELTDDEQKRRWLPGVVTGETITAIAMTEPGTGSDLSGIADPGRARG